MDYLGIYYQKLIPCSLAPTCSTQDVGRLQFLYSFRCFRSLSDLTSLRFVSGHWFILLRCVYDSLSQLCQLQRCREHLEVFRSRTNVFLPWRSEGKLQREIALCFSFRPLLLNLATSVRLTWLLQLILQSIKSEDKQNTICLHLLCHVRACFISNRTQGEKILHANYLAFMPRHCVFFWTTLLFKVEKSYQNCPNCLFCCNIDKIHNGILPV